MKVPGIELHVFNGGAGFLLWEAVMRSDIVVLQRPCYEQQLGIATIVKACGKKLIVDWDDNLCQLPSWNPHKDAFLGCAPHVEALAKLADVVTVSSKALVAYDIMDYTNYITVMNALAPEYVLVPLADHPFNHAKSDVGAQEAYLIGAKLIHNDIGEYKDLPETGKPRWLSEVNALRTKILRSLA
jgi:hypothetical protein